jgi:hypothetical protein
MATILCMIMYVDLRDARGPDLSWVYIMTRISPAGCLILAWSSLFLLLFTFQSVHATLLY